eukprot:g19642.t2
MLFCCTGHPHKNQDRSRPNAPFELRQAAAEALSPATWPGLTRSMGLAKLCLGEKDVQLEDPDAKCLWPLFEQWVAPNIGKREKWVPFHTVLAPHELFLVQSIHHNTDLNWSDFQRYLAIFIFRAHCQRQVFSHAQLPYLLTADFWHDPKKYFDDDGPITQSMMKYRRETHLPLQTGAFLSIPERLLEDNDENLVINTWAKMLMVSMDIAFPAAKLLSTHCEVGIGAREGLDRLFANQGPRQAVEALSVATAAANNSQMKPARHFWRIVERVEGMARQTPSLGAPEAENRSGKDAEKHYVEAVGQVLQNYKARHEELFGSVLSCSLRAQEEDARCQAASLKYFEICAAEMESQRDLRACLLEGYKHSAREEPLRRQVKTLDKTLEILKPAESEDVRQGLQSEGQEGLAPEDASEKYNPIACLTMARRAGGLAFLLLSAAGCAFLAPMPQIAAPAAQMAATQLLLAEIDMTEPYRPEEEPESPANIMIFLTLTFVLAAFILPLLFAGIQSKNADIAGADEPRNGASLFGGHGVERG